jgi:(1->4)-alpha-D-glucan 1-alpha-D-glucosylmutase
VRVPRATYRLQLSGNFTFRDAAEIVPYLDELGISHLYASPYLKARPGSAHGYDIIDHGALNPEIGSEEDYERLAEALRGRGMGQVLDLVPNHMGVFGRDNGWWLDVLENGPASRYARYFDIDWYPTNRAVLHGRVLLPVLGDHYRRVLEGGELGLTFEPESGSFHVDYYEHRCPLDPGTYPMILARGVERLERRLGEDDPRLLELQSIVTAFENLPGRDEPDAERLEERRRESVVNKGRLARLCGESPEVRRFVEENARRVGGDFGALHELLESQAYRLAYWRVASDEINYRRFFSINELAGIRMEDEEVFEATHGLVLELLKRGRVEGLRIDHPDGLYDPAGYFRRLQEAAEEVRGEPVYLLAEKILAHHERLPEDWPVHGTTGYEFANLITGLFVDRAAESHLDRTYRRFTGRDEPFEELVYRCKKHIMRTALSSELNVLSRRLLAISEANRRAFDFTINGLRDAISEVVACFPVYRTYITGADVSGQDRRYVEWALAQARKRSLAADTSIFDFLRGILLLEVGEEMREPAVGFVMKFQQYTGPVMAKGLEDTALYIYNRLVSLNEVGGEPDRFGASPEAFHYLNSERAERWPHAMLSTSTHDTKRSEDVRARIDALSELPREWRENLLRWGRLNRSKKLVVDGEPAPDRNDEYLLYQTLLGAWPPGEFGLEGFRKRVEEYMLKAAREAQVHTSWINANEEYEAAVSHFVRELLSDPESYFLREFLPFQKKVAMIGALNSLSSTLLKLTAPGVPDIYQGNEIPDFSLVDPDNRRPVDYELRKRLLAELKALPPERAPSLLEDPDDPRAKLYVTWKALAFRRERPDLFEAGEYLPLEVEGERADHVVAFARRSGEGVAVVVAPRLCAGFPEGRGLLIPPRAWDDTRVALSTPGRRFRNLFTGGIVLSGRRHLSVAEALADFPVALLEPAG